MSFSTILRISFVKFIKGECLGRECVQEGLHIKVEMLKDNVQLPWRLLQEMLLDLSLQGYDVLVTMDLSKDNQAFLGKLGHHLCLLHVSTPVVGCSVDPEKLLHCLDHCIYFINY